MKTNKAASPGTKAPSPAQAARTRSKGASAVAAPSAKAKVVSGGTKGKQGKKVEEAAAVRSESDSEEEEGEGGEQRLVIKLDKKQEKKLATGLKKIDNSATAAATGESGVVYLGRIPHGFFEKEMRAYFSQFGEVSECTVCAERVRAPVCSCVGP